jgi:hypothetical protein
MDIWHYIPETREVRDGNNLLVASDVKAEDAPLLTRAPELLAKLKGLMQVATWDDEYTEQDEFNEAFEPAADLVAEIEAGDLDVAGLTEEA